MATAYNEQTGQTLQLDEQANQWVPIANPDVPAGGELQAPAGSVPVEGNVGYQGPGNSPLDMLGAFNPAFAGTTGVAAGMQGLRAAAGAAPLTAPLTNAIARGGDMALQTAAGAGRNLMGAAERLPMVGSDIATINRNRSGNQILERVMQQVNTSPSAGSAGNAQRVREGLLSSDDFARQIGIDPNVLSPVQRADLDQTIGNPQLRAEIDKMRKLEAEGFYNKQLPQQALDNNELVKRQYTNTLLERAGLDPQFAPDPAKISETRRAAGREIGRIVDENYPSDIVSLDTGSGSLVKYLDAQSPDQARPALKILMDKGLVRENAEGVLEDVPQVSLTRFREAMDNIGDLTRRTEDPLSRQVASGIDGRLAGTLYEGMDAESKQLLSQARLQYRLLSEFQRPGGVRPDGLINPISFGKAFMRGESKNMRDFNDIAVMSDTAASLTRQANAGTSAIRTTGENAADAALGAITRGLGL